MDVLQAPGGRHTETMQQKLGMRDTIPDLFLKHPNTTVATYVSRQLKHLKHASETLKKHLKKHLKTIATIHNIQIKHT
jgi:uncharacterized circularly permuted ATP-grasp superfamily protein